MNKKIERLLIFVLAMCWLGWSYSQTSVEPVAYFTDSQWKDYPVYTIQLETSPVRTGYFIDQNKLPRKKGEILWVYLSADGYYRESKTNSLKAKLIR